MIAFDPVVNKEFGSEERLAALSEFVTMNSTQKLDCYHSGTNHSKRAGIQL